MSEEDNYIIINDYFDYKETILNLEEKNKQLEKKIKDIEYILLTHVLPNKSVFTKVVDTYNVIWSTYERMKLVSLVLIFFFGNKILSEPEILIKIFNMLKHLF
jgi:hypothetical protein